MDAIKEYDTIAAISTPIGEGAISIVRVSGEKSIEIANKIFKGKDLSQVDSNTINYGHVIDPEDGSVVDEVMASVMRAPKTFTTEDIVEINTHGGVVATNKVLQLLIGEGARLAEPGEYTQRAFLNGRIDLTQAEAVMDIIRAKTDRAMKVAVNQLDGSLSNLIKNLRQEILEVLANVEVNIDYPEYDTEEMTKQMIGEKAQDAINRINELLKISQDGKIVKDGIATAIVGKPNVGKSSILNSLIEEDKAIVTDVAGTTRDTIEQYISIDGIPLKLIDTAGIHDTDDKVEQIGVEKSRKSIDDSDLVMLILDSSRPLDQEDIDLFNMTNDKKRLIILNKQDLASQFAKCDIEQYLNDEDQVIETSALTSNGIDDIKRGINTLFMSGIETNENSPMVTNARQAGLLKQAKDSLEAVLDGINQGMPVDIVQIDLTAAWDTLGEITGESSPDELITQLFSQFCVGK